MEQGQIECRHCGTKNSVDGSQNQMCWFCGRRLHTQVAGEQWVSEPTQPPTDPSASKLQASADQEPSVSRRRHRLIFLSISLPVVIVVAVVAVITLRRDNSLVSQLLSSVVKIETDRGTESGFLIDHRGIVVTGSHAVGGYYPRLESLQIQMTDGLTYETRDVGLIYNNPERDLALLLIKPRSIEEYQSLKPVARTPVGEDITLLGHVGGQATSMTVKAVSGHAMVNNHMFLVVDTCVDSAYNGGPIVNQRGEVVAVTSSMRELKATLAVPIDYATSLLNDDLAGSLIETILSMNADDRLIDCSALPADNWDFRLLDNANLNNDFEMFPQDGWKLRGTFWDGKDLYRNNRLYFYKIGEFPKAIDVSAPDQEGLFLTKRTYKNFVLETNFVYRHRLDGYPNIDAGIIIRYQNQDNYYRYSTYSGQKIDEGKPIYEQVLGGLWELR